MEKIKASELFRELKGLEPMYFTTDLDGTRRIHMSKPTIGHNGSFASSFSVCISKSPLPQPDWKNSLREIDFTEDFTEERLSLINYISSYLAKELSLRDYNKIKGFFEEMEKPKFFDCSPPDYANIFKSARITAGNKEGKFKIEKIALSEVLERTPTPALERVKFSRYVGFYENGGIFLSDSVPSELEVGKGLKIYEIDRSENTESPKPSVPVFKDFDGKFRPIGDLGRIVISSTKESKSIFQEGDTVHVLSYSNQGELGVSTQGVVKAIKSNSFIAVEVTNGIEEIHEEKNISFTPFSIHEAGFSQTRPVREPKEGDWGFFYDNEVSEWFVYGQLHEIGGIIGTYTFYRHELGSEYNYFSHTPPQLAEGIPNPFDKC